MIIFTKNWSMSLQKIQLRTQPSKKKKEKAEQKVKLIEE